MTSALLPHPNNSGVILRRSSRLLRSENVVAKSTSGQGPNDFSQRRETVVSTNMGVTEDERRGLNSPAVDGVIAPEMALEEEDKIQNEKQSKKQKHRKRKVQTNADGEEFSLEKKPCKKRGPKPDHVYIIPDVEHKETTFRGRLGYACLNTVLRGKKPASESIFCSRTCRLESISKNGLQWVKEIGRKNVRDLITIIQWNEDNHIRFLRISSETFPFASHEKYGYSLGYCTDLLKEAGDLANKYGHRLTTHPGQFTQLGSLKDKVREAAVRELEYHCQMLDLMGVGVDGVMVVHGGGTYGDKAGAIGRLKKTISELAPHIRARLVLENDEMCYSAEDLLNVCEELDVPFVFDYHHDMLNPSSFPPLEIIKRADAIWKRRGIRPKQHLSEPRPGAVTLMERRAHADRCETLPPDLPDDMDLMIEAKDKEQAVFHLYRIYGLAPTIHVNLRPPNPNPSKETNGRKSNKRTTRGGPAKFNDEGPKSDEMLLDPQGEKYEIIDSASPTGDVFEMGPLGLCGNPNLTSTSLGPEECSSQGRTGERGQMIRPTKCKDNEVDSLDSAGPSKRPRRTPRSRSKKQEESNTLGLA